MPRGPIDGVPPWGEPRVQAGREIREARQRKELSQRALAAQVGVRQPTLSRIENGELSAAPVAERLVDALGPIPALTGTDAAPSGCDPDGHR